MGLPIQRYRELAWNELPYASHTVKDIPWMLKTFLSVGLPDVTRSLVVTRGIVLDFPEYSQSAMK